MKYIAVFCLILGCALIGRTLSLRLRKPVAINRAPALVAKNRLKAYYKKVATELGDDPKGKISFVIFLRAVAPTTFDKDPKLKDLCKTVRDCPLPLDMVYNFALSRLDSALDAPAKEILQEQLLKTDLATNLKVGLLMQNLNITMLRTLPPRSKMRGKTEVQLGPDIAYVLLTGHELLRLQMSSQQYVQTMMAALLHSKDRFAQGYIAQLLLKTYPAQSEAISSDAKKMGVQLVSLR